MKKNKFKAICSSIKSKFKWVNKNSKTISFKQFTKGGNNCKQIQIMSFNKFSDESIEENKTEDI